MAKTPAQGSRLRPGEKIVVRMLHSVSSRTAEVQLLVRP